MPQANYKEKLALLRFKIVEEFGGDGEDHRRQILMERLHSLLRYQRMYLIKEMEKVLDKFD